MKPYNQYITNIQAYMYLTGGHRAVDAALSTIMDGLYRNPHGFEHFQNPPFSFRYARTHKIGIVPALVMIFRIDEDGTVYLEHIEEDTP